MADRLPILARDPNLSPLLAATDAWSSSASVDLADAASVFHSLTSLPLALTLTAPSPWQTESPPLLSRLYDHSRGSFDLALLRTAAHHHLQSALTSLVAHTALATCFAPSSDLDDAARARLRATSVRGADALLTLHCIPSDVFLDDFAITFHILHRLGIPLAPHLFPTSALTACRGVAANGRFGCSVIPPSRPITAGHRLLYTLPHAYHHTACGANGARFDRHEAIAAVIAAHLRPEGPFRIDLRRNLASSTTSGTKIDINLTCHAFVPPTVSLDITVSCPLLPSYLADAAADASAIFAERDREKRAKHYAGCTARDRAYHTFCLTTFGGLGPPETIAYFDHVFLRSASREVAAGLSRRDALHRRQCFYAAVHAALVERNNRKSEKRVGRGKVSDDCLEAESEP